MSRTVRPALLIALVTALLASGCGIPDDTKVVAVGPGPSKGTFTGDDTSPTKNLRTDTNDKVAFLGNFLEAAAGDYDSAADEVKKFMSREAAASFKPVSTDIKVVHLQGTPLINPDEATAQINVKQVGTLNDQGVLTPTGGAGTQTRYDITIGSVEGQSGLFVTKMSPQALLISDTALSRFYVPRTIYFWNTDDTWLVPDVRYMSLTVPKEQQPTTVVNWLINGPAGWLNSIVDPRPKGAKLVGVVPAVTNDTLQINLGGQV